jgi:hypothetical protein
MTISQKLREQQDLSGPVVLPQPELDTPSVLDRVRAWFVKPEPDEDPDEDEDEPQDESPSKPVLMPRRPEPEPDPVSLYELRSAFLNHRHTTRALAQRALKEGRASVAQYAQQILEHLNYYGE